MDRAVRYMSSMSTGPLKVLIVDGYASKSKAEFDKLGIKHAAKLYQEMLARNVPRNVCVEFEHIYPTANDYTQPTTAYLQQFDGCAFTGSSLSAYAEEDDAWKQIELYKLATEARVSLFGSCWGLQVAAVALGGKVELNPKGREVGIGRKVMLTEAGRSHGLFSGKKHSFEAFMSHSDEVTRPPDGALVLAGNDHTAVQAMSVVNKGVESWFVQYHPEYDLDYFARLISSRRERMFDMGFFTDEKAFQLYIDEFIQLHNDPSRKDIAWKYGIDQQDMVGSDIKEAEPRNWLRYLMSMRLS